MGEKIRKYILLTGLMMAPGSTFLFDEKKPLPGITLLVLGIILIIVYVKNEPDCSNSQVKGEKSEKDF